MAPAGVQSKELMRPLSSGLTPGLADGGGGGGGDNPLGYSFILHSNEIKTF